MCYSFDVTLLIKYIKFIIFISNFSNKLKKRTLFDFA